MKKWLPPISAWKMIYLCLAEFDWQQEKSQEKEQPAEFLCRKTDRNEVTQIFAVHVNEDQIFDQQASDVWNTCDVEIMSRYGRFWSYGGPHNLFIDSCRSASLSLAQIA